MLRALGEGYVEVIADHGRICRAQAAAHGGREVDSQGDSFFFVFSRAKDAVRASAAMQLAFLEHEWPGGDRPRVRMGLHTGEPTVDAERYVGLGVHRAARIGAAAHGGQVLLSNATRELLEEDPSDGISIRDLGSFRLKDFDRPERLFQLIAPGLERDSRMPRAPRVEKPRPPERRFRTRQPRVVGPALLITAGVVVLLALVLVRAGADGVDVEANSIVRIDADDNEVAESIRVGRSPTGLVVTDDAIWVANEQDRVLMRIAKDSAEETIIGGIAGATSLARDERGNVYVSSFDHPYVWRIDPVQLEVVERFRVRTRAVDLELGGGFLWVLDRFANAVVRIDLARQKENVALSVASEPFAATFGYGALWVAAGDGSVSILRLGLARPERLVLDPNERLIAIAVGEGGVWAAGNIHSTLVRIDPDTRRVKTAIPTASAFGGLGGVAVGAGAVWAANWAAKEVVRIDPDTNEVVARIALPVEPRQIAVEGDEVWVSVVEPGSE